MKNNDEVSKKKVEILAVSTKPTPTIRGEDAKRFLENYYNPPNNKDFFKKCSEKAKLFKVKGKK